MYTSKQRVLDALNHRNSDRVPVDFGTTGVTGIHCKVIAELRRHYGLEDRPVKIVEPFQMLGEVDEELQQILRTDCTGIYGRKDMFSIEETEFREQVTPWGQSVLIAKDIDLTPDEAGDVYVYAEGDRSYAPCAVMPQGCYFVNAIERTDHYDEDNLNPEDNMAEFGYISDEDLDHFTNEIEKASKTDKAVIASFGGAALGDIAFVPGMGLKDPKGIRSVAEWYVSTALRPDYIHKIYERQVDLSIANYKKLWDRVGSKVDIVFTCGADFGTQESQFCSVDSFRELWLPHYKRMNDWIHQNTTWKVFKHCCGAIVPLIPSLIDAGFDILNPVQINAKDMDSRFLKSEFGQHLTFWGGGIDTQKVLPKGTPEEVKEHVLEQCEILGQDGGFVFTSVHNVQANAPIENLAAMFDALRGE
ncbi:MAG: uroporphyrinogen decarboxylase family protein [Dysgonomonas sp.]|nr:uroporphyrinogen decarboxylase family protein [Dysgonomonas sp.]